MLRVPVACFCFALSAASCASQTTSENLSEFAATASAFEAPDTLVAHLATLDPELYAYALLSRGEIDEAQDILEAHLDATERIVPDSSDVAEQAWLANGIVRLKWLVEGRESALEYYNGLPRDVGSSDIMSSIVCFIEYEPIASWAQSMWLDSWGHAGGYSPFERDVEQSDELGECFSNWNHQSH